MVYGVLAVKKIGIIGGLAWPSTADYYRLICKSANDHFQQSGASSPFPTPSIVIESLNIFETRSARGVAGDDASWREYEKIFRDTFKRLQNSGADLGMIASNTPHMRLHRICEGLDFPIVSILDTTAAAVTAAGGKNALILGTPVTMRSDVYPRTMRDHGVTSLAQPDATDIDALHRLIDVDLYQGRVDGAATQILEISKKYVGDPSTDIVCLACTELPLGFPEFTDTAYFEYQGVRFINTIAAHVDAVLKLALD